MSIGDDINKAAEVMAPELGIAEWAVKAIAAGVVALFLGFVVWKLFFAERQAEQKSQQVQTQATIATAKAGAAAGQDAVRIVVDNGKGAAAVDAAVKGAVNEILKAKGAAEQLDPSLDDLGRRSICVRLSAASLPECQSLQRTNP